MREFWKIALHRPTLGDETVAALQQTRARILNGLLLWASISGIFPALSSAALAQHVGWQANLILHQLIPPLCLAAFILRNRIPYQIRAHFLVNITILAAVLGVACFGQNSRGDLSLLYSVILATVLLGIRPALLYSVFGLASFISILVAIDTGHYRIPVATALVMSSTPWISALMGLFFLGGLTIIILGVFQRKMIELINTASENERRFRAMFDNSVDLIGLTDLEGRIMEVNQTSLMLNNQQSTDIIGHIGWEFAQQRGDLDLVKKFRQAIHRAASGTRVRFEAMLPKTGGGIRIIDFSIKPILNSHGEPCQLITEGRDITDIRHNEEALSLAAIILANTSDGTLITDPNGAILAVNTAFTTITGYSAEEAIGKNPRILRSHRHQRSFYQDLWSTLHKVGVWRGEIWNRRKNGEIFPEWMTINTVRNEAGAITNFVGVFSDISALKHSQEALEHLAHFDPLTGLPNRSLFHDRMQHAIDRSKRYGHPIGLLMLDLDQFKTINDSMGHPIGDELLCQVADRLRGLIRVDDTCSRLGGDEFAIIISNLGIGVDAAEVAAKIVIAMAQTFILQSTAIEISVSIGISLYPDDGVNPEELLRNADTALYSAKESGRNRYQFYREEMTKNSRHRLQLERDLRNAISAEEFELWYQPKIELRTGKLAGAEALLRWRHPLRGLVPPMDFIPLAERTSLIIPIGQWVIQEVCRQVRHWQDVNQFQGRISVNVAAPQIERGDLAADIAAAIKQSGLAPEYLEVEITESVLMESAGQGTQILDAIRRLGVTTSIDDFGTGYSSLAYLRSLPVNHLKIDRAFVSGLPGSAGDAIITRTIIAMGREMGFNIIAEGIETEAQMEYLREHGCDEGQGYLFSRPLPAAEWPAWVQQHQASTG